MWIRSQKGKFLTDCNYFEIEKFHEQYSVVTLSNRSDISVSLGIYSSEEKALKVLDKIQKRTEYLYQCPEAFQMPADEEVEV